MFFDRIIRLEETGPDKDWLLVVRVSGDFTPSNRHSNEPARVNNIYKCEVQEYCDATTNRKRSDNMPELVDDLFNQLDKYALSEFAGSYDLTVHLDDC